MSVVVDGSRGTGERRKQTGPFGSYNKTYGTLGGVVVFLVWMWLTNAALLLGAQLNSERERNAEIGESAPRAERELQMEPRNEPKTPKTT